MLRRTLRRRRVLAMVGVMAAGAAGALGPVAGSAAAQDTDSDLVKIRVATYNIHHAAGPDDVLDVAHTAKVLSSMHADVIGLQEVDRHWGERSDFADQARELAERLDMYAVYGANLDLDPAEPGQERRQYGTAILSRSPITSWSNTYLPKFGNHEQRGLLVANLKIRGVAMRVANTHLQHNDNLEREAQAAAIVELLGSDPRRTLLTGDLNALPDTPEIATLTNVFADAWAEVGEGAGPTYPVENPVSRIDYVLGSRDLVFRHAEVVPTDASDHLPLFVDLLVRR
ncbi:endonuclease/exonuclease/phosphatase family protein [Actinopolymorpha sp. B17G11]|uniref:endonuclease/exonuclease/phosphatase family protein n=1 Tax=unclassified Actinopolymorpha TaxID=2627063 RepID=UPI0032D94B54